MEFHLQDWFYTVIDWCQSFAWITFFLLATYPPASVVNLFRIHFHQCTDNTQLSIILIRQILELVFQMLTMVVKMHLDDEHKIYMCNMLRLDGVKSWFMMTGFNHIFPMQQRKVWLTALRLPKKLKASELYNVPKSWLKFKVCNFLWDLALRSIKTNAKFWIDELSAVKFTDRMACSKCSVKFKIISSTMRYNQTKSPKNLQ